MQKKYMAENAPKINSTKFGEIKINGKEYYSDMTIFWDGRLSYRGKEHIVELGEFMDIIRNVPEVIVVGLGQEGGLKISEEVKDWASNKNIDLYTEITPKAIEIFNAFMTQGKKVVGIFHVTC